MRAPERGALPLQLAATLGRTYGRVTETVQGLSDADFDRPTRCEGMPVGPLLVHLLYDAERALMEQAAGNRVNVRLAGRTRREQLDIGSAGRQHPIHAETVLPDD